LTIDNFFVGLRPEAPKALHRERLLDIPTRERFDKPSRNECLDLAINLQSFIFNVFGCIDNLALGVGEGKGYTG